MVTFDEALASRVIRAYADFDGLSDKDCKKLGIVDQCRDFNVAIDARVKSSLLTSTYPAPFVAALLGPDGARGLHARLRWIGNHHRNLKASQHAVMRDTLIKAAQLQSYAHHSNDVAALIEIIKDKETDQLLRCNAARALGTMSIGERKSVPALVEILLDKEAGLLLRCEVAMALRELGPRARDATQDLISIMQDREDEPVLRRQATLALGTVGCEESQEAVSSLVDLLLDKDEDPELRGRAASALGKMRPATRKVADAMIRVIEDSSEDAPLRMAIAAAIGETRNKARQVAIPTLIRVVREKSAGWELRQEAVRALCKISPHLRAAVPAFVDAIKEKDANLELRKEVVSGLGGTGSEGRDAIVELHDIAKDPGEDYELRRRSISALGSMEAVSALVDALMDKRVDWRTRRDAAWELGSKGQQASEAIPTLLDIIEDKSANMELRLHAALTLANIGAQDEGTAGAVVSMMLAKDDALLFPLKSPEPTLLLLVAMNDRDHEKRTAVGALLDRLSSPKSTNEEKLETISLLGNLGTLAHAAAPAIVDLLKDEKADPMLRSAAIKTLGAIWNEAQQSAPVLASLAKHGKTLQMRDEATSALRRLGFSPSPNGTAVPLTEQVLIEPASISR